MKYRPPSPLEVLNDAIALTNQPAKCHKALHAAPMLYDACLRLSAYVLDIVPTRCGARPLIQEAIARGWKQYCEVQGGNNAHIKRLRAFTTGLLSACSDLAHSRVVVLVGQNPVAWEPDRVPLSDWLRNKPGVKPEIEYERWTKINDETAVLLVACQILPWPHITALGGDIGEIAKEAAALLEHA